MALKIQVLTWYRHKIVAGLNVAVYCFVQKKNVSENQDV